MLEMIFGNWKPLKAIKNAFCHTLKALFVLKTSKYLSWLFGHVEKLFDFKDEVNFKIYVVTTWLKNNCNTHTAQYFKKWRQLDNDIWSVDRM